MFSIVIPLHNKKDFIGKALESIQDQSFGEWEAIVIDDGSTDDSETIVLSFKDERIKLFRTENRGVAAARNLGIQKASFEWIAFLDADDWWDKTFLKSIYLAMEDFPSHQIFCTGRTMLLNDTVVPYQLKGKPVDKKIFEIDYLEMLSKNLLPPINASNCVIKKALLLGVSGFNETMVAHEDHDLWMRIGFNNPMVYVDENLSFYRKNTLQRTRFLSSTDFLNYLATLRFVFNKTNTSGKKGIRSYARRFVLYNLYKYSKSYSKMARRKILSNVRLVLSTPAYWMAKMIAVVSPIVRK